MTPPAADRGAPARHIVADPFAYPKTSRRRTAADAAFGSLIIIAGRR
jgi:hypothetical protein